MLQEGVGGLGALASEPQEFRHFPTIDQRQILDEIENNPRFGKTLTAWLHTPGGANQIGRSAKRAILNELDGSHPESKGEWTTLRKRIRVILREIPVAIDRRVSQMSLPQKTAALVAIARGGAPPDLQLSADIDFGSIIGSVVSSAATAAGSIYKTKIEQSTIKQVANIQAQSAANTAAAQQQLQAAQAALAAAQGGGGGVSPLVWAVPAGIGVLGLVIWLATRGGK